MSECVFPTPCVLVLCDCLSCPILLWAMHGVCSFVQSDELSFDEGDTLYILEKVRITGILCFCVTCTYPPVSHLTPSPPSLPFPPLYLHVLLSFIPSHLYPSIPPLPLFLLLASPSPPSLPPFIPLSLPVVP